MKKFLKFTGILIFALLVLGFFVLEFYPPLGGAQAGKRLERIQASPNYDKSSGLFVNSPPASMVTSGEFWPMVWETLFGEQERIPTRTIPVVSIDPQTLLTPPAPGLRAYWLGHAGVLVEIDGKRLLVDPIFEEYASPVSLGPKRFHPAPIARKDLPPVDAVLISHDHYDHLEMETARYLTAKGALYYVPLGVGAHLERWGIQAKNIVELDWWQARKLDNLNIVCTQSRHYSGRTGLDRNVQFWSSWTVIGDVHRLYYSGDTGYSEHFKKIGDEYGPFDLSIIKIGAYHKSWLDIHMNPEAAVQAQLDLKGKLMLPVHWATFNMAIHAWDTPIKRALEAAKKQGVQLTTPRFGEAVIITPEKENESQAIPRSRWWEQTQGQINSTPSHDSLKTRR